MRTVITGGSGGLGLATARALVEREDARIVLLDREPPSGPVWSTLQQSGRVDFMELDLTADAATQRVVRHAADSLGGLDAVVNAAGLYEDGADDSVDAFRVVVDVNLVGAYSVLRAASNWLFESERAAVVNLASVSGRTRSVVAGPAYVASKAGLIGLTKSLAARWADRGVRVNCVAPGATKTPMTDVYTSTQRAAIVDQVPLARFAEPHEVAAAVRFLLSDEAAFITGHTLDVNGGLFMS